MTFRIDLIISLYALLSIQGSLGTLTLASHASCNTSSLSSRRTTSRSKRRVSLHYDVAVIPIPMRSEYLNREDMWYSANELHQNATRNTIEFASEGFNWRQVADDEHMIHLPSGERIHPIHFINIAKFRPSPPPLITNQQQERSNVTES